MPEGDTVWRAARRMNAALAGETLRGSDFRVPRLAAADLSGQRISTVAARGKHLLTRFDGGLTLHTHFGMEGAWYLHRPGAPASGGPDWQIRAILTTSSRVATGYRLVTVELLATSREQDAVGHLGPDVLGPDWDLAAAVARLRTRPDLPIGAALLDQRLLAGLGNIWRTEACFLAGVSPWTPVGDVPDLAGLVRRAQAMIEAGAHGGHQVTTGSTRPGEEHWVYGRAGRTCRRCAGRILVADQARSPGPHRPAGPNRTADPDRTTDRIGEEGRRTTWCPRCQAGPTAPAGAVTGREPPGRGGEFRSGRRRRPAGGGRA
ncbi:putative endonuclease 8 2 [Frankia canadensis]|uniref:DNA-(apurinic or apyrimidinic site) lyase n=1 Tax=Frankia canadensis TaxID=1836972 RepID=A0A2I2KTT3_9ACTN|nr:DNA-formamidopyrimidine glycosylase family protein [Frankia canadensis]SNQ49071.1 putative endonuclease 8 2 [Frankia canadensis]SOU56361.1 putative endonuclease 8 2 [Frankia canadensis]